MKKLSLLITLSVTLLASNLHAGQRSSQPNWHKRKKNRTAPLHATNNPQQTSQESEYILGPYESLDRNDPPFNILRKESQQQAQKLINQIHNKHNKTRITKELRKELIAYYKAILPETKKELKELQNSIKRAIQKDAATQGEAPKGLTAQDVSAAYFRHHLSYAQRKLKNKITFLEKNLAYLEGDTTNEKTVQPMWLDE